MFGQRVQMRAARAAPMRVSVVKVEAKDSRIGKKPITVPKGVTVTVDGQNVKVKVGAYTIKRCLGSDLCLPSKADLSRMLQHVSVEYVERF